ncbi:hypothetical protein ABC733_18935 [Mangrovibacter sp. SLW1]
MPRPLKSPSEKGAYFFECILQRKISVLMTYFKMTEEDAIKLCDSNEIRFKAAAKLITTSSTKRASTKDTTVTKSTDVSKGSFSPVAKLKSV